MKFEIVSERRLSRYRKTMRLKRTDGAITHDPLTILNMRVCEKVAADLGEKRVLAAELLATKKLRLR